MTSLKPFYLDRLRFTPQDARTLRAVGEVRYELAQSLLASVSPEDELRAVQVHDWQRDAVREALADARRRPGSLRPAEAVEEEIERDLRR